MPRDRYRCTQDQINILDLFFDVLDLFEWDTPVGIIRDAMIDAGIPFPDKQELP